MVEIAVVGVLQFQRAEADVIQSLIVNAECLVRVLDQLMHRESRVVGLDDLKAG